MGRNSVLSGILGGILLFLAQSILFKNMVLFDSAFCFAYVITFLLIPSETSSVIQLIFAFIFGILLDSIYNTLGMHAAASLVFVFAKIYWVQIMMPSGGYDSGSRINMSSQGLQWLLLFSYPLILLHSLVLLFIEAGGLNTFFFTLSKAFYSSLFTMGMVLIIQYLFFKRMK